MKFRENKFFQGMPPREKNLVEAMWKSGSGYPIPYDRDYLSVVCFAEGLDVAKTLPKNWFYKTMYNLRATGVIDMFFAPCGEARVYFVERKPQMESNKSGPFEEGAKEIATSKWTRAVQRNKEDIGRASQIITEWEKADTRRNTENVTIPPKKHTRHIWSRDRPSDIA